MSQIWLIAFDPSLWPSQLDFVDVSFARREVALKREWIGVC
jgi:hypothetical protein